MNSYAFLCLPLSKKTNVHSIRCFSGKAVSTVHKHPENPPQLLNGGSSFREGSSSSCSLPWPQT